MNKFKNKIELILKQFKSEREAGRFLGLTSQSLGNYKKGSIPDGNNLIMISKKLNLSIDWLLLNKGNMYLSDKSENVQITELRERVRILEKKLKEINRISKDFSKQ